MRERVIFFFLVTGTLTAQSETTPTRPFSSDSLARSPWGAVARSFVVPGWGQAYNNSWWKAPVFVAGDVSMMWIYQVKDRRVTRIQRDRKRLDFQLKNDPFLTDSERAILRSRFNNLTGDLDGALNDRNLYGWLFALSHMLGMVDAYVDAHLFEFSKKVDMAIIGTPLKTQATLQIKW